MGAGQRKNLSYAIDRYPDLKAEKQAEQRALNEMLGHDLSTAATADLVAELVHRSGVDFYNLSEDERVSVEDFEDCGLNYIRNGPAKIIVVKEQP